MSAKKILMVVGDYVEDYEAMIPFQALQMVGHCVHAVCPERKVGDIIRTAIHDFDGAQTYSEKPGHGFELNASFDEIDPIEYNALVLPGGRAPEYLRMHQRVIQVVKHFADTQKPIAAICHGIQILTAAGIVLGRSVSGYPTISPEIEAAGGRYVDCPLDGAHVDGNLVTAPAWPAHPEWLAKLLGLLGTRIEL